MKKNTIFVLWGDNFDSLATAIFVTQLRKAGLRVKLVALSRRNIRGTQGLTLIPDHTLEQVRTQGAKVSCFIIPPHLGNQLLNDPRIDKFIEQLSGTLLVTPSDATLKIANNYQITYIPDYQDLFNLSRLLGQHLLIP